MKKPGRWLAVIGFLLWMTWKVFFQVGWLEFSIGFSLFILVPLLLEEVVQTSEGNLAERWLWGVMKCSLPFAVAGALSLTVPAGLEAVAWSAVWLVYTLLVAYGGLVRMFGRGKSGLEEWSIDVGLIYLGFGGVCLVLSRMPWDGFSLFTMQERVILSLFFHCAAFFLAVVTGFFGRYRVDGNRVRVRFLHLPYAIFVFLVNAGPFLVLWSFWSGGAVLTMTIALYTFMIGWMCIWWFWLSADFRPWIQTCFILSSTLGFFGVTLFLLNRFGAGRISWVGVIAAVPPYGFWVAFLFSWLVVFAWRGIRAPRRVYTAMFPILRFKKGD